MGAVGLFDLATIAALQLVGTGHPGPWLVARLALNRIDGVRALSLVALGADVSSVRPVPPSNGFSGQAEALPGSVPRSPVGLLAPVLAARRAFSRRDF
jgi:hypothetical protein